MIARLAAVAANCTDPVFPPSLYRCISKEADGQPQITGLEDAIQVVVNIIQLLMTLAGALAVIFVIIGGIQYITSTGDPGRTAKARSTITTSVLGILLLAFLYPIIGFVTRIFE
jgi:small-conductance mechanosensitive channel